MTFAISSPERRVAIVNAVHELFSLLPFKIGSVVMHQTFNLLTGGIRQGAVALDAGMGDCLARDETF